MRLSTFLVFVFAFLATPTDEAEACSCVQRSYAEHVKAATQVFVARAGKPVKTGDALKQTFTVLATLKGTATKQFVLDRPATPPCASKYEENEVAILFTSGGDLSPCLGNVPLGSQVTELAAILAATKTKRGDVTVAAVEAALREALGKYTHDRPQIWIRHPSLAGSFRMGKSNLELTKKPYKGEVRIKTSFATDSLALVDGTYNIEGLRFTVLLYLDTTWKVAWSQVVER
ncbi:MAG: hypothetical protein ACKV2T_08630 [Kofleriaceae bacterium]